MIPFDAPIDTASGVPYYRQVIDRVMLGISDGTLSQGDRLPTVRSLAVALKINPNTVGRAYRDLEIMGVVETRPGSGTYIAALQPRLPEFERQRQLERLCTQMAGKAQALGFSLDELMETLREIRRGGSRVGSTDGSAQVRPGPRAPQSKSSGRRTS